MLDLELGKVRTIRPPDRSKHRRSKMEIQKPQYLFHDIKIRRFDPRDTLVPGLLDLLHLGPRILVMHNVNQDALVTKPPRSSWTCRAFRHQKQFVCHLSWRQPRTDAVDIRLDIWPQVTAPTCSLAIIHERKIVVHHHVDLQHVNSARDHVGHNLVLFPALPKTIDDQIMLETLWPSATIRCAMRSAVRRC